MNRTCHITLVVHRKLVVLFVGNRVLAAEPKANPEQRADFARDVLPIFAAKCVSYHGPDEQEGQLRMGAKAILFQRGTSGVGVVPGKGKESLLLQRVLGHGDEEQMPLDDDPVSKQEIDIIRRWIDRGWDYHGSIETGLPQKFEQVEQPVATLLTDVAGNVIHKVLA